MLMRNNRRSAHLMMPPYGSDSSDARRTCNVAKGSGIFYALKEGKSNIEEEIVPNGALIERYGPPSPRLLFWDERRGAFAHIDKGMGKYW